MTEVPYNLPYDNKIQRLKRRYQGLSKVAASINDLYIYGVYPSNYPNLTTVLEQAKDHCKEIIKETKKEIAFIENPHGLYDLVMNEELPDADQEKAIRITEQDTDVK
jgi:hypothetical protein